MCKGPAELPLCGRLKKLHRIAVWVFHQDLLSPGANDDLIAETDVLLFQLSNTRGQVLHVEDEPIPATGFWAAPVRHGASTRTLGSTEPKGKVVSGNAGERRPGLLYKFEAETPGVESDGTVNVLDQISDGCHFLYPHPIRGVAWAG